MRRFRYYDSSTIRDLSSRLWPAGQNKHNPSGSITETELAVLLQDIRYGYVHATMHRVRHDTGLVVHIYAKGKTRGEPSDLMLRLFNAHIERDPAKKRSLETRQRFLDTFYPVAMESENRRACRYYNLNGVTDKSMLELIDPLPETPANALSDEDYDFFEALNQKLYYMSTTLETSGWDKGKRVPKEFPQGILSEEELATIKRLNQEDKIFLCQSTEENGRIDIAIYTHPYHAVRKANYRHLIFLRDCHLRTASEFEHDSTDECKLNFELMTKPEVYRQHCVEFFDPLIKDPQNQANFTLYDINSKSRIKT